MKLHAALCCWHLRLLLSVLLIWTCNVKADAKPTREEAAARLAKAEAMFQERCKKAGVKIYRTAENVEGIFLMKVRPDKINFDKQFEMDDPYGSDLGGSGFIESFVRGSYQANTRGPYLPGSPSRIGYSYVEAIDPTDGKRYRYTGGIKDVEVKSSILNGGTGKTFITKKFALDKTISTGRPPRYGVTYDDISTREEREFWIASSSLRVIDLKTNEVMAERIGYMMDRGQGSSTGNRSPWLLAADHACPEFAPRRGFSAQARQAQDFVEKILKPAKGK